jgi:hypothetical protein
MLSHERVQTAVNNIDPTMMMDMPPPSPTAAVLSPDHWESSTQVMGLVTARVHFEPLGM